MSRDNGVQHFGLLIAYLLPGCVVLWGTSFFWEAPRVWFGLAPAEAPTIGGTLVLTVAASGAGLVVSLLRWLVLDSLHHATGLHPPAWDFARLTGRVEALELLVEGHYRHYQAAGNLLVAVLVAYLLWRVSPSGTETDVGTIDLTVGLLVCLLFAGSRDALQKYYARAGRLLAAARPRAEGSSFATIADTRHRSPGVAPFRKKRR